MSEKIVGWVEKSLTNPETYPEVGQALERMAREGFARRWPGATITHEEWKHEPEHMAEDIPIPEAWLRMVEGKADTTTCSSCQEEYVPRPPGEGLVQAGGFCMPSEVMYAMPEPEPMCPDCHSRYLMVLHGLPDPGRKGENLRVPRGGITYPTPAWKD